MTNESSKTGKIVKFNLNVIWMCIRTLCSWLRSYVFINIVLVMLFVRYAHLLYHSLHSIGLYGGVSFVSQIITDIFNILLPHSLIASNHGLNAISHRSQQNIWYFDQIGCRSFDPFKWHVTKKPSSAFRLYMLPWFARSSVVYNHQFISIFVWEIRKYKKQNGWSMLP